MNNWSIDSKIVQYFLHLLSVIDHPVYSNFWATLSRSSLGLLRVRPKVHTLRWGEMGFTRERPLSQLSYYSNLSLPHVIQLPFSTYTIWADNQPCPHSQFVPFQVYSKRVYSSEEMLSHSHSHLPHPYVWVIGYGVKPKHRGTLQRQDIPGREGFFVGAVG